MSTVTLTADTFKEKTGSGIVFVDFWATWCGPCKMFGPIYEAMSDEHSDIVFGKVDIDAERELADSMQIMSVPTLMVFRDGYLVFSQPGALNKAKLSELIDGVQALDMDKVREQVASA